MFMALNMFNLDGYAVNCLRHKPFNLDGNSVDCLRHNHSTWMVMPLTVFGITVQVEWLCRRKSTAQNI